MDLILITRGGGSLEDLWAFNEEVVARAIFESALPVVSAIGHEIDFTISDFVADVRAATPSVAGEILTEGVFSSLQFLVQAGERLGQLLRQRMEDKEYLLTQLTQRLARVHPRRRLNDWLQRLDEAQASLQREARQSLRQRHVACQHLAGRLARVRPALVLHQRREVLEQATLRLREQARHRVHELERHLDSLQARLRLLGPEQVLARGYSITLDARTGVVLRHAAGIQAGQRLRTRLQMGEIISVTQEPAKPG